jgi:CheY-like chemotaxis protein
MTSPRDFTAAGHAIMATVLVADDIKSLRQLFRLTLNQHHTVIEAEDGGKALELLRRHRPDVAILDVMMPVLSGLQVCRLLRADPDLRNIGVIIISANADDDEGRQAGADRFIVKPFLPSALLTAVDDLVRSRALI